MESIFVDNLSSDTYCQLKHVHVPCIPFSWRLFQPCLIELFLCPFLWISRLHIYDPDNIFRLDNRSGFPVLKPKGYNHRTQCKNGLLLKNKKVASASLVTNINQTLANSLKSQPFNVEFLFMWRQFRTLITRFLLVTIWLLLPAHLPQNYVCDSCMINSYGHF